MLSRQQLFRPQAIRHYVQLRERDVFPRFLAPRVFLSLWLLLGLLFAATLLAWSVQVPTSLSAYGVVVQAGPLNSQAEDEVAALLFVPATPSLHLSVGQALLVQITVTGAQFKRAIARIEPGLLTPEQARERYGLTGDVALLITRPSVVVTVPLGAVFQAPGVVGTSVSTQIEEGSRPVFLLLLDGLHDFVGG